MTKFNPILTSHREAGDSFNPILTTVTENLAIIGMAVDQNVDGIVFVVTTSCRCTL